MYISGAKIKEHCFNISRDILESVFYCSSETIYEVITFFIFICIIQNINISTTKKDIPKKKMPFFFTLKLKSLSNKKQLCFTSWTL